MKKKTKSVEKFHQVVHQFVVRVVQIKDESPSSSMYWTDSGHGFTDHLPSATRYSEMAGIRKLGELLHSSKTICELLDVSVPYESPVKNGTVVVRHSRNVTEMVVMVPEVPGDMLTLISPHGSRQLKIRDFLEELVEEDLQILWDPERSMCPDDNDDYLAAHGFINDNGEVCE